MNANILLTNYLVNNLGYKPDKLKFNLSCESLVKFNVHKV